MSFNFNNAATTNYGHAPSMPSTQQSMLKSFAGQIHHQIAPLDYKIQCQRHQWSVHKSTIVPKSSFFDRMAASRFKESTDNVVNLPEDDPRLIARLILFCYSGKARYPLGLDSKDVPDEVTLRELLTAGSSSTGATSEPLVDLFPDFEAGLHFEMYVLADKYGMPGLEASALEALRSTLRKDSTVFWRLVKGLEDTPEHMEARLESILIQHSTTNMERASVLRDARFKHIIHTRPDMAWRIVKSEYAGFSPSYQLHIIPSCTALHTSESFDETAIRKQLGEYACWVQSITKLPGSKTLEIEFGDGDMAAAALKAAMKDVGSRQLYKGFAVPTFTWASSP